MDTKPRVLIQLDSDPQPSVFDGIVALDAGVGHVLRHGGVRPQEVRDLVHGAMFTRGVEDLRHTAIFVGGSKIAPAEALFAEVQRTFFGPLRVSAMLDANGANTTAAAAVWTAQRHVPLAGATVLALACTGPVGQRVVRLLAAQGARVRIGSPFSDQAAAARDAALRHHPQAEISSVVTGTDQADQRALSGVDILIAAGPAGTRLMSAATREAAERLKVAMDLNAVEPVGLEGISPSDKAVQRNGATLYGSLALGGTKMKIHRAAIQTLFRANDQVLDVEAIYQIGCDLLG